MTRKPETRPSEGGSYIRQRDGSLRRADDLATPDPAPEKPAGKPAAKPAVKED